MGTLADWLEKYNWKIYYNQKNEDNRPVFHANTNSKPDLFVSKADINVLVEVKPGNKHQDILDGYQQILEYAGEYHIGRTKYKKEDKENIRIDAFVLATQYSLSGFLYNDEQETDWMSNTWIEKNRNIVEKPITHSVTRLLWRQWEKGIPSNFFNIQRANKLAEGAQCPSKRPKIGTLLSRVDRNRRITGEPYMFLNSNKFSDMTEEDDIYPFNQT